MKKIILVPIANLKPHEHIIPENLEKVKNSIQKDGFLINPVIVDRNHLVILDGHHRVQALEALGYTKVPAHMVDYFDENIKIFPRRAEVSISKKIIIEKALAREVFPCKTSKHVIPGRPMRINIPLKDLK